MHGKTKWILYVVGIVLIFIAELYYCIHGIGGSSKIPVSVACLEDVDGALTIEDVQKKAAAGEFSQCPNASPAFGTNRSVWWLRVSADIPARSEPLYLSVYNTTMQSLVMFLPDGNNYRELRSGWEFQGKDQDQNFLYPVFNMPEDFKLDKLDNAVYLRLYTPFIQNYTLELMYESQFEQVKRQTLIFVGLLIGILLAMVFYNLIIFIGLKDKTHFYYVIYTISVIFYQMSILGVYRLMFNQLAEKLVSHVLSFGSIMFALALVFLYSAFDIKKNFPIISKLFLMLIFLNCLGPILVFMGQRSTVNIISSALVVFISLLLLILYIRGIQKDIPYAFYFLVAESIMCIGLVLSFLRYYGFINNSFESISILLISSAGESVTISSALVYRIRKLTAENEATLNLYKNAEAAAKLNELAYLQAQIKPHFLYNAMNAIAALCRLDAGKARELLLDLSSYLQHIFDYKNPAECISVEKELEFVQAYVRIQQARFKDKFQVFYELDDIKNVCLPPLMLQPLVENAIRHGVLPGNRFGCIIVSLTVKGDSLLIQVTDNGVGMTDEELALIFEKKSEKPGGIGLSNIKRRLEMFYATTPDVQSCTDGGTVVTITIPLERKAENESDFGG